MKKLPKWFADKVDFNGKCWLWMGSKNSKGYGNVRVSGNLNKSHRYSWSFYNGDIPENMCVCHKCDVPACVNPDHLFLGTHQDNMDDKVKKGRQSRLFGERNGTMTHPETRLMGEKHANAKLTQLQVDEIRRLYKRNSRGEFSTVGLGKKYGVSNAMIGYIVRRKWWKGLDRGSCGGVWDR